MLRRQALKLLDIEREALSTIAAKPQKALDSFLQIIEIWPNRLVVLDGIARTSETLNDFATAAKARKKIFELMPHDFNLGLQCVQALIKAGRFGEANERVDELLLRYPAHSRANALKSEIEKVHNIDLENMRSLLANTKEKGKNKQTTKSDKFIDAFGLADEIDLKAIKENLLLSARSQGADELPSVSDVENLSQLLDDLRSELHTSAEEAKEASKEQMASLFQDIGALKRLLQIELSKPVSEEIAQARMRDEDFSDLKDLLGIKPSQYEPHPIQSAPVLDDDFSDLKDMLGVQPSQSEPRPIQAAPVLDDDFSDLKDLLGVEPSQSEPRPIHAAPVLDDDFSDLKDMLEIKHIQPEPRQAREAQVLGDDFNDLKKEFENQKIGSEKINSPRPNNSRSDFDDFGRIKESFAENKAVINHLIREVAAANSERDEARILKIAAMLIGVLITSDWEVDKEDALKSAVIFSAATKIKPENSNYLIEALRVAGEVEASLDEALKYAEYVRSANQWREIIIGAAKFNREDLIDLASSKIAIADNINTVAFKEVRTVLREKSVNSEILRQRLSQIADLGFKSRDEKQKFEALRDTAIIARSCEIAHNNEGVIESLKKALSNYSPIERCESKVIERIFDILRRAVRMGAASDNEHFDNLKELIDEHSSQSANYFMLRALCEGNFSSKSIQYFEKASELGFESIANLDPYLEIANIYFANGHFDRAARDISKISPVTARVSGAKLIKDIETLQKFDTENIGCYPEFLFDRIWENANQSIERYKPIKKNLLFVCASLGGGGSERQLVTVLKAMAGNKKYGNLSLAIRSVEREEQRFYYDTVFGLPIEKVVYGENWRVPASIEENLIEFSLNDDLKQMVNLLPQRIREDVIRVAGIVRKTKPRAVYFRQDMAWAAFGAMIAGAPKVIVHRGSLSPDYWGHGEYITNSTVRPFQHLYKLMLKDPRFVIVNNSVEGAQSDMAFAPTGTDAQHIVVYNGIEFGQREVTKEAGQQLREQLGIPPDAPVLGGVFRFVNVKRPLLWLEIAKQVLSNEPRAHFIICGDGPLQDDCVAFAKKNGFADRLHLPGLISDVSHYFEIMDVSLLVSSREGMPNVVVESQYFGTPAVCTRVGGAAEALIPGETGQIIDANADPSEFVKLILPYLQDKEHSEQSGAKGSNFVRERFSVAAVVKNLTSLFD